VNLQEEAKEEKKKVAVLDHHVSTGPEIESEEADS